MAELRTIAAWFKTGSNEAGREEILLAVESHLDEAKATADGWRTEDKSPRGLWARIRSWTGGSDVERTMSNIDAAQADLLRLAPMSFLRGQMSDLQAHVRHHTPTGDPRRTQVEDIARHAQKGDLNAYQRDAVVFAARGASAEARNEVMRVRSFRNVLLVTAGLLTLAAIGVGILGAVRPTAFPLCFNPDDKVVCPTSETTLSGNDSADEVMDATATSWDIPLVQVVGMIAAAVAAAAALGKIRGTSTPYSLPVALAILKLPTGALTAVLGLLLMRGEFIPGLSALDSPAQIIAWAVLFGYAQQIFTRLADQQAHNVLDDVGGSLDRASTG